MLKTIDFYYLMIEKSVAWLYYVTDLLFIVLIEMLVNLL